MVSRQVFQALLVKTARTASVSCHKALVLAPVQTALVQTALLHTALVSMVVRTA